MSNPFTFDRAALLEQLDGITRDVFEVAGGADISILFDAVRRLAEVVRAVVTAGGAGDGQ